MFVFGKADEERAASEKNSKAATFAGQLALIFGALTVRDQADQWPLSMLGALVPNEEDMGLAVSAGPFESAASASAAVASPAAAAAAVVVVPVKKREREAAPLSALEVQRHSLPVFTYRDAIVRACRTHQAVVVVGETGSGKTTQIPRFLLEAGLAGPLEPMPRTSVGKGRTIAVSQPRRVAAMTVSRRVAQEMGCTLGDVVGYTIRFDDCSSAQTRIRFATDGMLLREARVDPLLSRYAVVVLDEAHERSLNTDVLFGVVKRAMQARPLGTSKTSGSSSSAATSSVLPPLRVVVMSATLDVARFAAYFEATPITVPGRQFPVAVEYLAEPSENVVDDAVAAVLQLHLADLGWPHDALSFEDAVAAGYRPPMNHDVKSGSIESEVSSEPVSSIESSGYLVFLPGQEEIEDACDSLRQRAALFPPGLPGLHVCPLYAALPADRQLQAFRAPPAGLRKVVVSTNIAETSVTVSGVRVVIDSGIAKVRDFHPATGMETLAPRPVSQDQARQRAGRAGREAPGRCVRLFPESDWDRLAPTATPEILRASLDAVVLQLVSMGVRAPEVARFPFLEPPAAASLRRALQRLLELRALDPTTGSLTERGERLAALPLDPVPGSLILAAADPRVLTPSSSASSSSGSLTSASVAAVTSAQVVSDMCTLVALLSADDAVLSQSAAAKDASVRRARARLLAWEGDHVTLLRVWDAFLAAVRASAASAAAGRVESTRADTDDATVSEPREAFDALRAAGLRTHDDDDDDGGDDNEDQNELDAADPKQSAAKRRRAASRSRARAQRGGRLDAAVMSAVSAWCREHGVSLRALRRAGEIRTQLLEVCASLGIAARDDVTTAAAAAAHRTGSVSLMGSSAELSEARSIALRRAMVLGYPLLLANKTPAPTSSSSGGGGGGRPVYRVVGSGQEVGIHPASALHVHAHAAAETAQQQDRRRLGGAYSSARWNASSSSSSSSSAMATQAAPQGSALYRAYPDWVVFSEVVATTRAYARSVSRVEAEWLPDLAPDVFRGSER